MDNKQNDFMPRWVLIVMCLIACLGVPALIYVAYTGVEIPQSLIAMVGLFALNASGYAFHGKSSTELILEFLKNFQK